MTESVYLWSTTASSNDLADGGINWQEGQVPGSVNASARGMMATIAKLLGDINCTKSSGGSLNAYTLASPNTTYTALVNGIIIGFRANFTNTGASTFNLSSIGAKKIKTFTQDGESELAANQIRTGGHYHIEYDTALDAGNGAWILLDPTNDTIPVGQMAPFAGGNPPTGWLLAAGQAVSRTTYAALFALFTTTYGAGDGVTTFNVPDLRGRVVAGKDDMNGSAASRLTVAGSGIAGNTFGGTGGAETVTLATTQIPVHTHPFSTTSGIESVGHTHGAGTLATGAESADHQHGPGTLATGAESADHTHGVGTYAIGNQSIDHTHSVSGTTSGGSAHSHGVNSATGVTGSGGGLTPTGTVAITDLGHAHTFNVTSRSDISAGGAQTVVSAIATTGAGANVNTTTNNAGLTAAFTGDAVAAHTHPVSIDNESSHTHTFSVTSGGVSVTHNHLLSGSSAGVSANHTHTVTSGLTGGVNSNHSHLVTTGASTTESVNHTHSVSGTSDPTGGGLAHNNAQPTIVLNYIIKY